MTKEPTTAQICKAAGLKSLKQLSTMTGMSRMTLDRWRRKRRQMFDLLVQAAVIVSNNNERGE